MRFGIMQGRLSPPQGDSLQFFPNDWQQEFDVARALGFDSIEWIFDTPIEGDSLFDTHTLADISAKIASSGVKVSSICADYFMVNHLTKSNLLGVEVLARLVAVTSKLGISIVGVPFVESHIPKSPAERHWIIQNILDVLDRVPNATQIALEMDLPADEVLSLVQSINSPRVGVCYDTGNAMTFRFDAGADLRKLGKHLKEVHLKDRLEGTRQSVYLGTGSVDFDDVFNALASIGFDGLCTLQAWRGDDYLGDAKRQLEFTKALLNSAKERRIYGE